MAWRATSAAAPGYHNIVRAVLDAARVSRAGTAAPPPLSEKGAEVGHVVAHEALGA